jgi:hypothetical protein
MERSPLPGSLRFDAGELDYLGPFLGFAGKEAAEIACRARERRNDKVGHSRLEIVVREGGIDLLVEPRPKPDSCNAALR